MPDTELLTDQQFAEIEVREYVVEGWGRFIKLRLEERDSLIATVKQLRDENGDLRSEMSAFKKDREESDLGYMRQVESVEKAVARVAAERDDLQSQLEQLRAENERLRRQIEPGEKSDVFSGEYAALGHDERETL